MSNIKEFVKKNKKMVSIGGVVILAVVAIVLILIMVNNQDNKKSDYAATKNDFAKGFNIFERKKITDMENVLIEMGRDFYENLYYEKIANTDEERAKAASKFQQLGIKINIDNLSRYKSDVNKAALDAIVNPSTGEACNKENTMVKIYPKGDFGRTEYDIKVEFDCPTTTNEDTNSENNN